MNRPPTFFRTKIEVDPGRIRRILLACCVMAVFTTQTAPSQWGPDLRLSPESDSARTSYTNARCVAANGDTVHAVWQGKQGSDWRIFHRRSLDGGATWGESSVISNNSGADAGFPCICMAGADLFVVWHDERDGNSEIYFRHSPDAGASWKMEQRLTNDSGRSWFPSIAVNGKALHVVWSDTRHGKGEIYYLRSGDAGERWGGETRLTDNRAASEAPSVEATGSTVHVAWYEGLYGNYEVMYRGSRDGGATWAPELRLTDDPFVSSGLSMAADGPDVHLVCFDFRSGAWDLHYIRSGDGGESWSEDVPLTLSTSSSWFPSVAASGAAVHVVWVDESEDRSRLLYKRSSDRGITWCEDVPIVDSSGAVLYPSVSLAGAAIDVVWSDSRSGVRSVYFTRNPAGNLFPAAGSGPEAARSSPLASKIQSPFSKAQGSSRELTETERTVRDASKGQAHHLEQKKIGNESSTEDITQELPYRDRLYYACKTWGLVKYNHPRATDCSVDMKSALLRALPAIKAASTRVEFNDALLSMLAAAGPVPPAKDTLPFIPPELRRNRDFGWLSDGVLRDDVRAVLDSIVSNARPGPNCLVKRDSTVPWSYLVFPHDAPMLDVDARKAFPDEIHRLYAIFVFWNILDAFNPNKHILDVPWDSTLRSKVLSIAVAEDYDAFHTAFRRFTAALNDAHVEGMTRSVKYQFENYAPKIVLLHTADGYTVRKSGIPDFAPGDLLLSVGGKTTEEWEDSLSAFVSAGNDAVFHRTVCGEMLRGTYYSPIDIAYRDGNGLERAYTGVRSVSLMSRWYYGASPRDTLASVKWKKWGCNVGYVNMGNLGTDEVDTMYSELQDAAAIIFDVRNYPRGSIEAIADRMFADRLAAVEYLLPDTAFAGAFTRETKEFGVAGNPTPYRGRVIILCDEQTQSHAEWTCMILRAMPGATIVGGATAGADGNVTRLRFTREISTGYTSIGVYWPGGGNTQREGIVPDVVVVPTANDIRLSRDPALEKALELAGCTGSR